MQLDFTKNSLHSEINVTYNIGTNYRKKEFTKYKKESFLVELCAVSAIVWQNGDSLVLAQITKVMLNLGYEITALIQKL